MVISIKLWILWGWRPKGWHDNRESKGVQDGILQLPRVKWSNRARCHSAELEAQSRDWIAPKLSWRQCYRERVALTSAEAAMLRNHDISCQNYPSPTVFRADGHGGVLHRLNPLDHPHAPQRSLWNCGVFCRQSALCLIMGSGGAADVGVTSVGFDPFLSNKHGVSWCLQNWGTQ